jgi:hypothetical protein
MVALLRSEAGDSARVADEYGRQSGRLRRNDDLQYLNNVNCQSHGLFFSG